MYKHVIMHFVTLNLKIAKQISDKNLTSKDGAFYMYVSFHEFSWTCISWTCVDPGILRLPPHCQQP